MDKLKALEEERDAFRQHQANKAREADERISNLAANTENKLDALSDALGTMQSDFKQAIDDITEKQNTRFEEQAAAQSTLSEQMALLMEMVKGLKPTNDDAQMNSASDSSGGDVKRRATSSD